MLDLRSPVIFLAPLAGLLLACLGWLVLGGEGRVAAPLDEAEARLAALPVERPLPQAAVYSGSGGKPLFVVATPASLRLEGVSRTPRRTAALISINGEPAQWIPVGTTLGGFTLSGVSATGVIVENLLGRQTIALGESLGGTSAAGSGGTPPQGAPPPGLQRGLEPASAPGIR
ncbi:hypothetical protein [Caulobacter mirabilis]|uniref:Uncharacterized protein n=1 Tax=Caulobacter mirabilis TaxID=69666 RepID=A0A2D2AZJ2_9CAUL|nr:hypothetical protein [Caulobacter mirabilis]ATQ43426.1 hypothetical protein CSW64_13890 [Caulobacter mirabilis]